MANSITENEKTVSAFVHLSTFTKFFFPFGNFIAPIILWTLNKEKPFVDYNGKQAINFQLSMFLYTIIIGLICIPFFAFFAFDIIGLANEVGHTFSSGDIHNINNISGYILLIVVVGLLLLGLFGIELYAVISASMSAAKGIAYKYPFCISFIKSNKPEVSDKNQPSHEHNS